MGGTQRRDGAARGWRRGVSGPGRPAATGATRTCPHCRETVLESAAVCPQCRHHLRASTSTAQGRRPTVEALRVEGTLTGPPAGTTEYTMLVTIRNERGEEIARQLVGVGALRHGEHRDFSVVVETVSPGIG